MKKHCILLFFCCLNLLMNTAGAYNLKQVADKEYMSNSSITCLLYTSVDVSGVYKSVLFSVEVNGSVQCVRKTVLEHPCQFRIGQ